jgi:hypothetical protein
MGHFNILTSLGNRFNKSINQNILRPFLLHQSIANKIHLYITSDMKRVNSQNVSHKQKTILVVDDDFDTANNYQTVVAKARLYCT